MVVKTSKGTATVANNNNTNNCPLLQLKTALVDAYAAAYTP